MGVTSLIMVMPNPAACKDRSAASLPAPGPFMKTSTFLTPYSIAFLTAVEAATCAAKGVPFLEPLKPWLPALAHASTFPERSVMLIIVLLNVALMCATPLTTFFLSFLGFAITHTLRQARSYASFFLAITPFLGPFLVL